MPLESDKCESTVLPFVVLTHRHEDISDFPNLVHFKPKSFLRRRGSDVHEDLFRPRFVLLHNSG